MSKNVVETDGQQMTSQYGAYALHAGLTRLHALCVRTRPGTHARARKHTQTNNKFYLLLFHSNNDTRTRLNGTLYAQCPSCLPLPFLEEDCPVIMYIIFKRFMFESRHQKRNTNYNAGNQWRVFSWFRLHWISFLHTEMLRSSVIREVTGVKDDGWGNVDITTDIARGNSLAHSSVTNCAEQSFFRR
jgi:hypothetical protein